MLVFLGVGRMMQMAATNTYVQTLVDDDKRSRVMAFHSLAFLGVAPLGALMMGKIAQTRLDAPGAFLLAGLACVAGAVAFAGRLPGVQRHGHGRAAAGQNAGGDSAPVQTTLILETQDRAARPASPRGADAGAPPASGRNGNGDV
jgi:hypothetical protein